MSRYPQPIDRNAALYHGTDRATAQLADRLGLLVRSMQDTPLVRVISKRAYAGFYTGYEIDGPLPSDGSVAPVDPYYGGQLNQRPVCVICTGDFGTGAWSIPLPRTFASGVRRQGLDGETVVVVDYWGQGDPNGTSPPPGDDGPGGGGGGGTGVGGGGGTGANPGGLCSLQYTLTLSGVSGSLDDVYWNAAFTLTWNGSRWTFSAGPPYDAEFFLAASGYDPVTGLPNKYTFNLNSTDLNLSGEKGPPAGAFGCPSLGLYTTTTGPSGAAGTVS